MLVKIILAIIVLHLVAGFAFILWKLAGPVSDDKKDDATPKD